MPTLSTRDPSIPYPPALSPLSIDASLAAVAQIAPVKTILSVVTHVTGLGFAAVARVTDTRWIACAVKDEIAFGLVPGGELDLRSTICHEIRDHRQVVAIDHVANDPVYCEHHTPAKYGFQSYISVPITLGDGSFFGTLCAIDPKPARVKTAEIIGMFTLFAELIAHHLDVQVRLETARRELDEEREVAKRRETFIAVVGHDLRNPLSAISGGAELLRRMPQTPAGADVVMMIKRSAARMVGLIDNILDFARGRLAGGINLKRKSDPALVATLQQAVGEIQAANPNRLIATHFAIDGPVFCDASRIAQLLSNLLANAVTHGDAASPIEVTAQVSDGIFALSVLNRGVTIAPEKIEALFEPFARGAKVERDGLGLGLYIAAEIARAHGGVLSATSVEGLTTFALRMPATETIVS